MTKQHLKPVALAVSLALSLTACGSQDKSSDASAPAPAKSVASAAAPAAKSAFDISELDSSINACQDFNGFVNAKWVAANPIPNDRTRWGAFDKLADDSLNVQHTIVENAAKDAGQRNGRFDRAEDRLSVRVGHERGSAATRPASTRSSPSSTPSARSRTAATSPIT